MTILFAGGEAGSCRPLTGGVYEVLTTDSGAACFRSENARCAMRLGNSATSFESPIHAGVAAVGYSWCGYYFNNVLTYGGTLFEMYAGATAQIRIVAVNSSFVTAISLEYWDGSAWQVSDTHSTPNSTITRFEVFCNKTSGALQLYVSGSLVIDETESLSHLSNFTHCRWYGVIASTGYVSEWAAATTPNAVAAVETWPATGDGAVTDGTGDYTGIDEITYSDADGITFSAGGQINTFTNGRTASGYVILAVTLGIRGKKGASGPTGQQGVLRIGGSNYVSSTDTLSTGYGAFSPVWETNPATAGAWADAAVEGLEFGVKAIT